MRLVSARFRGLKGIYSKSGQKEIYIDFTKCIHDIVYIVGKNGSGKSTLMSALQPLPDPPQMYIDHELGEKEITYTHDNNVYIILIQYPIYANGQRATTKAYFTEIDSNGQRVELNSNGTIGSYKDVLFAKFCLDPNFISLSHLSVENRGIVDKKPAERKKFVANLLESVEVYNDIYKTLVKRSGVFKSMVNSITAKIDSIGEESKLLMDKTAADNRLNSLQQQRQSLEHQITSSQSTIKLIDPDGLIQSKYKKLFSDLSIIKKNLTLLESSVPSLDGIESLEDATSMYFEMKNQETSLSKDIESINESIQDMLISKEEDAKIIFIKNQKYTAMISETDIDQLNRLLAEYRKKIFGYEKIFKTIGVSGDSMTQSEYIIGLNSLEDLRTSVLNVKSYSSDQHIQEACTAILNGDSIVSKVNSCNNKADSISSDIELIKQKLTYFYGLTKRVEILSNRPATCSNDTCSFIRDALEAQAENPNKRIEELETQLNILNDQYRKQIEYKDYIQMVLKVYNDLNIIIRSIRSNSNILKKLPIGDKFTDIPSFLERVKLGDTFNDIFELYQYIEYSNVFELYKNDKAVLLDLESQYKVVKAQQSMIDDLQTEIDVLVAKTKNIDEQIKEKRNLILSKEKKLVVCQESLSKINDMISKYRKINELRSSEKEIESQLRLVSDNIEKISKEVENINKAQSQLVSVNNEIGPLTQMKDSLTFSLAKLTEYKSELQVYNDKYSTVELIKKYSSPTKGGIQTIFMQLYMDKTLSLSNQLLGLMFEGELELLPYIISENEFRIPVRSNVTNLVTDDISNCSTSEKSMIAMIMSFVLGFQGSPMYNIIRLDEIDGGLDQSNRSIFPIILSKIMSILLIEQSLIISHSSESDMSNVDIISLTPVSHETLKGNVIFQL